MKYNWIEVSKLPTDEETVLLCGQEDGVSVFGLGYYIIRRQEWAVQGTDYFKPTHWQKLEINENFDAAEYEKITGFCTHEELSAYEKGRDHEELCFLKFVKNWDGKTNSAFGQLLADKMIELSTKTK